MAPQHMRALDEDCESSSQESLMVNEASARRWRIARPALAVLAGLAIVATVLFASHSGSARPLAATPSSAIEEEEITVVPPREKCSKTKENCIQTKCCATSGYTCFEQTPGYGKCMKTCTAGAGQTCLAQATFKSATKSSVSLSSTTMFCWSFYAQDTGSPKKSYQLDTLRTNLFLSTGIFGCESYKVYSDVAEWLSPGSVFTTKVDDLEGNFHFQHRKEKQYWINAGMFKQIWKVIKADKLWESKDWTIKVDTDAVFLPDRLRQKLQTVKVTGNGVYLENCKYVNFGFFGNLEVFSRTAASTYINNLDSCSAELNWRGSEKDTGNEPWGEDLFAQKCMDLKGVDKVSAWDITTDGTCEADRPEGQKKNKDWQPDCSQQTPALHPFKKPWEYFKCLEKTQR